ncbi:HAMP domain-containing histidine kinase [Shewanella xiamenensis]|jgi:signal transduction histidine kinase|uniref:sensor histidine kinase n=1 Tax=Shewanella TaxID=22 RepID=UPI00193DDE84|nr:MULTISPECIES: HAMP domain-containing sensor histidine kinase [Shewanella]MBW0296283.1 ATPase [Shewanella xiamenensis]MCT8861274.1 HAMP domain-containing histidine kinase [Shewanella xiamenensis]MDH1314594.1 HAMP domain-containing histidine kinase [Shewanella xiamenensis]MDL3986696.1 HAMP domain-containing histidine kinase [Shewanella xiamenensis]QRK79423.1 HAMP domain-containing histidine kinase [Shewanella sp. LZH-2]
MQAPKFSLKRSYQVWGVIFLLITLGVNSFIPLCMMCAGMISMHEVTMHNAGQAAEALLKVAQPTQQPLQHQPILKTDNLTVYSHWLDIPPHIRELSHNEVLTDASKIRYEHAEGPIVNALSVYYPQAGQPLYVWLQFSVTHDLQFAPKNMTAILLLVLITFCASASLAFYMQSKVITPVHQISHAIKQHDWEAGGKLSLPQQEYAELKAIVDALDNSILQLQEAQQRELNFLRFASHELRTPVAICQSSFEILALQQGELTGPTLYASQATNQMKSLIETLLWLTNKECSSLEKENVALSPLLASIIDEQQRVHGHEQKIQLFSDDTCLPVQLHPLKIILSNLLRNSIEHGGMDISITQDGYYVEITNSYNSNGHHGFGLGLLLVKRLANQLGWIFTSSSKNNLFTARLEISNN